MAIERFVWTAHALLRLDQRRLDRADVERAIRDVHGARHANDGQADWHIQAITAHGVRFEAVYDQPVGSDENSACVVSVWRVDQ